MPKITLNLTCSNPDYSILAIDKGNYIPSAIVIIALM